MTRKLFKFLLFTVVLASTAYAPRVLAFTQLTDLPVASNGDVDFSDAPSCTANGTGGLKFVAYNYENQQAGNNCASTGNLETLYAGSGYTNTNYFVFLFANGTDFTNDTRDYYWVFERDAGGNWTQGTASPYDYGAVATSTRIISTYPTGGDTVPTSTPFNLGGTGYINQIDYATGTRVSVNVTLANHPYGSVVTGAYGALLAVEQAQEYEFPVLYSGDWIDYEVETYDVIGKRHVVTTIEVPRFSIFGFPFWYETIYSTTSEFIVGELSIGDQLADPLGQFASSSNQMFDIVLDSLASTTLDMAEACSPLSGQFSFQTCFMLSVLPQPEVIQNNMNQLRAVPPWGWGFRLYDIFSGNATGTATTTLPSINYTFGSTSAFYQAGLTDITFDPFGTLRQTNNLMDNALSDQQQPKTVRQIFEPIVNIIVYMALFFVIIRRLFGIDFGAEHGALDSTGDDSYRYKEYMYKHQNNGNIGYNKLQNLDYRASRFKKKK